MLYNNAFHIFPLKIHVTVTLWKSSDEKKSGLWFVLQKKESKNSNLTWKVIPKIRKLHWRAWITTFNSWVSKYDEIFSSMSCPDHKCSEWTYRHKRLWRKVYLQKIFSRLKIILRRWQVKKLAWYTKFRVKIASLAKVTLAIFEKYLQSAHSSQSLNFHRVHCQVLY